MSKFSKAKIPIPCSGSPDPEYSEHPDSVSCLRMTVGHRHPEVVVVRGGAAESDEPGC